MIENMKVIIENYLNTKKLPNLVIGTYQEDGVKLNQKITVPMSMIHVPALFTDIENEKFHLEPGNDVYMLNGLGGQKYIVLDVMKK